MRWLFVLLIFISADAISQCKTFVIGRKGDTLNCTDKANLKQGRWVVTVPELRGEPGYEEEGIFKDGKKESVWRVYTLEGDVKAIETYRWGYKDGISQYYTINGLQRMESWKAVDPEDPWDTIEVPDPIDPYKVEMKRVKLEGYTMKHGTWKYYDPYTGALAKTETWFLDKLQDPNAPKPNSVAATDSTATSDTTKAVKTPVKVKPKEVQEFEKRMPAKRK
jgi:hypothetical protein